MAAKRTTTSKPWPARSLPCRNRRATTSRRMTNRRKTRRTTSRKTTRQRTRRSKRMNRSSSRDAFARARKLIPGGANSPARAFGAVGGEPIFIARGEGPFLIDIDGNRYIDYIGSWGPLILGHSHPRVVAAVEQAL